jgi:cell division septation protein DedD
MDRQKIFWVVLSVSVFVVIVLVVGVMLLRQKPAAMAQTPALTPLSDTGTQVYEYQQSPGSSTMQNGQSGDTTQSSPFYIGDNGGQTGTDTTGTNSSDATATPLTQNPSATSTPMQSTTTSGGTSTTTQPSTTKPAVTKPATAKPPVRTVEYWIQTGAYKSPSKADELVTLLGKKGLTGRVFSTVTAKSETFYRVRVGPYKNKGEAEKFLAIVKNVQGLEGSYISQVGATATPVN